MFQKDLKSVLIIVLRIVCLAVFLYNAINISLASVVALLALCASLFILHVKTPVHIQSNTNTRMKNPLKGKPKVELSDLPADTVKKVASDVMSFVCYDAEETQSTSNFQKVKQNSDCVFSRKAKVWGSADYVQDISLVQNIKQSLPTFLQFCILCELLGLDGFIFDLPPEFGNDIKTFGKTVREMLIFISNMDPTGYNCMSKSNIDRKGWVFQFNKVTFFITTFAPCYPESHPRYAYEADRCFVLFQPEISFAQHDLPSDSTFTSWDKPKTVRDQIRKAFKDSGRQYSIRDTVSFPMVYDIVRPLDKYEDYFQWWRYDP